MKELLKNSVLLLICIAVFSSCDKDSQSNSPVHHQRQADDVKFINSGSDVVIGTLQLRRKNGEKKKAPRKGEACDCVSCFGLCRGHIIIDDENLGEANAILQDLGAGLATIFFLEEPEEDADVDPTFYIDENVVIEQGFGGPQFITVQAGEYTYSNIPGNIVYGDESYSYFGTVNVNFVE